MPAKSKRRFGRVRELPSGRWQVRYKGPDGFDRPAPHTFESKTNAERWLTVIESDVLKGDWTDPDPVTTVSCSPAQARTSAACASGIATELTKIPGTATIIGGVPRLR